MTGVMNEKNSLQHLEVNKYSLTTAVYSSVAMKKPEPLIASWAGGHRPSSRPTGKRT
jgi:hypothetical protein